MYLKNKLMDIIPVYNNEKLTDLLKNQPEWWWKKWNDLWGEDGVELRLKRIAHNLLSEDQTTPRDINLIINIVVRKKQVFSGNKILCDFFYKADQPYHQHYGWPKDSIIHVSSLSTIATISIFNEDSSSFVDNIMQMFYGDY